MGYWTIVLTDKRTRVRVRVQYSQLVQYIIKCNFFYCIVYESTCLHEVNYIMHDVCQEIDTEAAQVAVISRQHCTYVSTAGIHMLDGTLCCRTRRFTYLLSCALWCIHCIILSQVIL